MPSLPMILSSAVVMAERECGHRALQSCLRSKRRLNSPSTLRSGAITWISWPWSLRGGSWACIVSPGSRCSARRWRKWASSLRARSIMSTMKSTSDSRRRSAAHPSSAACAGDLTVACSLWVCAQAPSWCTRSKRAHASRGRRRSTDQSWPWTGATSPTPHLTQHHHLHLQR